MVNHANEVAEPIHIHAVVQGYDNSGARHLPFVHGAEENGHYRENSGCIIHSKVEPAPTAVMSDEVGRGLVQKLVLPGSDHTLLLEGPDDALTAHRFMEITVHR